MSQWLLILFVLACPVGMCGAMWLMSRYTQTSEPPPENVRDSNPEVTRLQAEIDQLRAAQRDAEVQRPGPGEHKRP